MNARTDMERAAQWGWPMLEEVTKHASFKSERAIARKMRADRNRPDMVRVFANLAKGIPPPFHRQIFLLDGILVPMGLANRREIEATENAAAEVEHIEQAIELKLREVANLIEQRDAVAAEHGISVNSAGNPWDWLMAGLTHSDPQTRFLAEAHTLPPIEHLDHRYDWKYWPALSEVLQGLADRFTETFPEPDHPDMRASAEGYRGPRRLLRILWHAQFRQAGRHLPLESDADPRTAPIKAFRLDDTDMATLLRLVAEPIDYTPDTIKKARHYLRDQAEGNDPKWSRFLAAR
ncbi:hypothetical protein [Thioalkalivibrio sp. ALE12]|uniref:hypothetical protein n=1 Tax=Thioalkalivibrio sp. ALE12 TaxID=1158170 RepID=UPI00037341BA|nr:hypothetical protein [Thioalkalivibrio sp. ALE12]